MRRSGGQVFIFSDLHPSGKKLKDITGKMFVIRSDRLGIAGICRFAIDLDILDGLNQIDSEDIQEYSDEES